MKQIGRYEVLEEIARGGMGIVYRAHDPATGRQVAAKVMLDSNPDPRFRQEVDALARLQHPAIVSFHDVTMDASGRHVLIMELVEGESLKERIRRGGALPIDEALGLVVQLCEAVRYAHQRGVLHRDVKPDNVLVTRDGRVKLTDFGLGKVVDQSLALSQESLTKTGAVMGTPAYMPPEQARGDKGRMGPTADIYALGATLYALLTGHPPFEGSSLISVLHSVLRKPASPPSDLRVDVQPELDAVVLRCLAKDPADRYPSVAELITALTGVEPPATVSVRPPATVSARTPATVSARLRSALAVASLGLAVGLGIVVARVSRDPAAVASPSPVPSADESPLAASTPTPSLTPEATPLTPPEQRTAAKAAHERGLDLREAGEWEQASAEFDQAVRLCPDDPDMLLDRGRVRLILGDTEAAIEDFGDVIRLSPDAPGMGHFFRAKALVVRGDPQGAYTDFQQTIRALPDFPQAYHRRGVLQFRRGEQKSALADFDRAIRLEAKLSEAERAELYFDRALARDALDDVAGAIKDLTEVIGHQPTHATALAKRGELRQLQGDFQGAIADLTESLRLAPHQRNATLIFCVRSQAYAQADNLDQALADCDEALRRQPDFASAHYQRGIVRSRAGQIEGAIEDFTECLRHEPENDEILLRRGLLWLLAEDRQAAIADMQRATELGGGVGPAIWYAVVSGDRSSLTPYAKGADWGAALASCLLDRITTDALLTVADSADDELARLRRRGEAHAYMGLRWDMAGDVEAAKSHYVACLAVGTHEITTVRAWVKARLAGWGSDR